MTRMSQTFHVHPSYHLCRTLCWSGSEQVSSNHECRPETFCKSTNTPILQPTNLPHPLPAHNLPPNPARRRRPSRRPRHSKRKLHPPNSRLDRYSPTLPPSRQQQPQRTSTCGAKVLRTRCHRQRDGIQCQPSDKEHQSCHW